MEQANTLWPIIVGIISAGWVIVTYFRDTAAGAVDRTCAIVTRLLDDDKIIIENPDIQEYLSQTAEQKEEYFQSPSVLKDLKFYKAKAFAYRQLNSFDELLSIADKSKISLLWGRSVILEMQDWENYICIKLRHPLYRSILNKEGKIFGKAFRKFWDDAKATVSSEPADPFVW